MVDNPRFDISAAVVRQLGDELVSDEVTAILELVKNAYDADADYAHVIVETERGLTIDESEFSESKGFITIEDNGMGMNRSDIENGWLMISLSAKRNMKASGITTPKGRTPLGDKGLGRLSTQKLGSNLEIFTHKDNAKETLRVSFSWLSFTDNKSLGSVPVTIEPTLRFERNKGTKLVITGLRNPDVWKGTAVNRLINDLSQIISPFENIRPFRVTLSINGTPINLEQISSNVRNAAVARFVISYKDGKLALDGKVRIVKFRGNQTGDELEFFERQVVANKGQDFFEYLRGRKPVTAVFRLSNDPAYFVEFGHSVVLSELPGAVLVDIKSDSFEEKPHLILADPGPFESEIDEFLLRADQSGLSLSGLSTSTELQKIVKRHVGIKVFRDGFAVRPYGLNGQDWLQLSAQQTSGASYYGLRPQNVIGFVAISEKYNGHLKEKTDREGFVNTPYTENLQILMCHATAIIDKFYEWVRREYTLYRKYCMVKPEISSSTGKQAIYDANKVTKDLTSYVSRAKSVKGKSEAVSAKLGALTERIKAEPIFASKEELELADLIKEADDALKTSHEVFNEIENYATQAERLSDIVASIGPRMDVINNQLQDFTELAGLGMLTESLTHEVLNQIDRLMHSVSTANAKARAAIPPNTDLLVFVQEVSSVGTALRRQIGHLAPSLRYQRDKFDTFSVSELINASRDYHEKRWIDIGIKFVVEPSSDFHVRTHHGRITQVIDNILHNSEYWLRDAIAKNDVKNPTIFVKFNAPFVRIWDNGRGVDSSVENALFEPFVTLKPRNVGRGLGLFISTQILESMGCSITLLQDRNAVGRRFIFELDLSAITH
jgi:signal transduction histidine kinase